MDALVAVVITNSIRNAGYDKLYSSLFLNNVSVFELQLTMPKVAKKNLST
jgi:hypothetical protein